MTDIKYTPEDIDRICEQRVNRSIHKSILKKGIIVEWTFKYPNGNICGFVESAFPINPDNFNEEIGDEVCVKKIKNKLWELCGQYSIITGEKL